MQKPTRFDLALWLTLAAIWSSSYTVIKVAVVSLDPALLVASRLLVGSIAIYLVMKFRGLSLSKRLFDWACYAVTGPLASALPFLLITHGEQTVDSALAAILMGATPVITVLLAAWAIPNDRLTLRSGFGILGGVVGVAILVGPAALSGLGTQLGRQLSIVTAAACYGATTFLSGGL